MRFGIQPPGEALYRWSWELIVKTFLGCDSQGRAGKGQSYCFCMSVGEASGERAARSQDPTAQQRNDSAFIKRTWASWNTPASDSLGHVDVLAHGIQTLVAMGFVLCLSLILCHIAEDRCLFPRAALCGLYWHSQTSTLTKIWQMTLAVVCCRVTENPFQAISQLEQEPRKVGEGLAGVAAHTVSQPYPDRAQTWKVRAVACLQRATQAYTLRMRPGSRPACLRGRFGKGPLALPCPACALCWKVPSL